MKLYMKQKILSLNDEFLIKNEIGNTLYYVDTKRLSLGRIFHIYDEEYIEVSSVKQKAMTVHPVFFIYGKNGIKLKLVQKGKNKSQYKIEGKRWEVIEDSRTHDYQIRQNETIVVSVGNSGRKTEEGYTLNINEMESEDIPIIIAVIIAMETI